MINNDYIIKLPLACKNLYRFLLLLSSLYTSCVIAAPGENEISDIDIKAVFLYHFANFVTWPEQSDFNDFNRLNYCVTGKGPLTERLRIVLQNETAAEGRQLIFKGQRGTQFMAHCRQELVFGLVG